MIGRRALLLALLLIGASPASAAPAARPPRVRIETEAGAFVVELAAKQAPRTAANFLAYVDQRRFDGTSFYRAAPSRARPGTGLIQGGIRHRYTLMLNAIPHEPTSRTGLRHRDGTISMARNAPGTAMGDFFITLGPAPWMDAAGDYPGYAAFGQVISGMPTVRRILAAPTIRGAGDEQMKDQIIARPIRILRARRLP